MVVHSTGFVAISMTMMGAIPAGNILESYNSGEKDPKIIKSKTLPNLTDGHPTSVLRAPVKKSLPPSKVVHFILNSSYVRRFFLMFSRNLLSHYLNPGPVF